MELESFLYLLLGDPSSSTLSLESPSDRRQFFHGHSLLQREHEQGRFYDHGYDHRVTAHLLEVRDLPACDHVETIWVDRRLR